MQNKAFLLPSILAALSLVASMLLWQAVQAPLHSRLCESCPTFAEALFCKPNESVVYGAWFCFFIAMLFIGLAVQRFRASNRQP